MKTNILIKTSLVLLIITSFLNAKSSKLPVKAFKVTNPITIDGKLDEDVWKNSPICNFIQKEPNEGVEATEKTCAWIAYDEKYLYIAAKLYDSNPSQIEKSLYRRDGSFDTDMFTVFLDTYNDKRNGYYFAVNPGGSMNDGILYNDSWDDSRWDGIWESAASIDGEGWNLEIKIPYSQLRFNTAEELVWGVNFKRKIKRTNEITYYVMVPKEEGGFVSHFASLDGIKGVKPKQRFELLPYIVQKAQYIKHDSDDPYYKGNQYRTTLGADFKVSIGSNLNLDGTINPDFGQVEVDPAVLNLSAFETYYDEKRPFFLEGTNIFDFAWGGINNHWGFNFSWPTLFYSRRIGQAPRGDVDDYDYIDTPKETRILGAAKLTGKVGDNINVGVLSAVTERTYAEYKLDGKNHEAEVEPLTHFGVVRMQKELNDGKNSIGFMVTSVNRDLNSDAMKDLYADNALTFGVDGWITLDDSSNYVLSAAGIGSYKHGNNEYISRLQRAPYRYFQRPDASPNRYDTTKTYLAGWYGRAILNKQKGNFYLNASIGAVSPGFDYNDLGFQYWADKINIAVVSGYRWFNTTDIFRNRSLYGAVSYDSDFEGNVYRKSVMAFYNATFVNYYYANGNLGYSFETDTKSLTRGGPLAKLPAGFDASINLGTDSRSSFIVEPYAYGWADEIGGKSGELGVYFSWKPSPSISFTFGPSLSSTKEEIQWVDSYEDSSAIKMYGSRYIFAELNQTVVAGNIRLNWTFSPTMSLQLFLQPMFAVGDYSEFKELSQPKSYKFNKYGENGSTINYSAENDEYTVNADPANNGESYTFSNPDFNFKSLRGNIVFRWEFLPGSVFYLVWSHEQTNFEDPGRFNFKNDFRNLMTSESDNVYLAKIAYWFDI